MKLEELLMQTIPTLQAASSAFQHIEEFAFFTPERLTENCLGGQSKGSWKVGAIKKAFVMMTGTGGSVNKDDAEDVFNPRGFNLLVINEWGQETGIFIPAFSTGNLGI
jgi:hypothetical protein